MAIINRYSKCLLATFLVGIVCTPLFSQLKQPNRFEKEYTYHDEDFLVIPLDTEGLVLIREKNKFKSGKQFWEVILLDTVLQEKATLELELSIGNELTGYEYAPGFAYLLFNRRETKGEMNLFSIDLKSEETRLFNVSPELDFKLTQFCKAGDNFVFGGYVNLEPAVLLYIPANNNIKIVPGFFLKDTELIDMRANQNQTFNTVLLEKGDRETRKITLRTFDASGKQLFDNTVNIDEDITLQSGISSALIRDDLMIIGTWGKRNTKQAKGFYTLPVNPFGEQKVKRVHFGELSHYLDYSKPKRAAKIKLQTLESLQEGKLPDFSSYVMPIKIEERKTGFLVLAEVYTPSSTNAYNQYPSGIPYYAYLHGSYPNDGIKNAPNSTGNNMTENVEVDNVESVLISFDSKGSVVWDYSIKLDDIKSSPLEQITDFQLSEHTIQLLYKKESELRIKKIEFGTDKTTEFSQKIQLSNPYDEVRSEYRVAGEIRKWFGKNFYVWGYQSIRNKPIGKTRDVFYINKVVVQ